VITAAYLALSIGLAAVLYIWVGYPLLVGVMHSIHALEHVRLEGSSNPFVSVIIPAHNEQDRIAAKLTNCLELDYPCDRLEIIVSSDGSTDRTEEIVHGFMARDSRIRWLQSDQRAGKSGVQNLAAASAHGDILFFTDANAHMGPEVLWTMVDDLADPSVGLVTATVHLGDPDDAVAKGQGFYWRYELFLRIAESDLGILATASGQAMAVRRDLFRPLPLCFGDDCIMPLDVRLQGYRVVQERSATVFDTMPHTIQGELRARVRMTARNWAGTLARPALLHPLRFPLTSWALISHKLLRWLTPFFLGICALSNLLLAFKGREIALCWLQFVFYLSAFVGWQLTRKHRAAGPFGYSFSFCLANVGFLLGMVKAFRNQKIVAY
jgi:cellulose synthase/poly-beta-1,6-N-acetylglucosamine synthase-like glycosyltransferase